MPLPTWLVNKEELPAYWDDLAHPTAAPVSSKLRALADTLDCIQYGDLELLLEIIATLREPGDDMQNDLRRWADQLEAGPLTNDAVGGGEVSDERR